MRPSPPGPLRRGRRRSPRRSRTGRRRRADPDRGPDLANLRQERPDVRVVGVHQDRVRAEDVTRRLRRRERGGVDQERLGRRFLDVHDGPDLARDLRFDVVALVEHERDPRVRTERSCLHHLVHDPEQLERVRRADHQVIVGVEARVEIEPAEPAGAEQRRDDELDVRPRSVVPGVDDDHRLRSGGHALDVRGSPVGDVHRIERRLEELVLEDHPLVCPEACVDRRERLRQAVLASPDVVLPGVVRPVREPQLQVARPGGVHDVDAGKQVIERLPADARVGAAHATEHVVVVLERVRVDGPEGDALVRGVAREVGVVVDPVPRDVERNGGRDTGEPVHLRGVGDLLVRIARHALLGEDLEPGPGVAEGPRRQFDPLGPQRRDDGLVAGHVCLRRPSGGCRPILIRPDRTRRAGL